MIPMPNVGRDPFFNNMGWVHHDQGRPTDALDLFQQDGYVRAELGELLLTLGRDAEAGPISPALLSC